MFYRALCAAFRAGTDIPVPGAASRCTCSKSNGRAQRARQGRGSLEWKTSHLRLPAVDTEFSARADELAAGASCPRPPPGRAPVPWSSSVPLSVWGGRSQVTESPVGRLHSLDETVDTNGRGDSAICNRASPGPARPVATERCRAVQCCIAFVPVRVVAVAAHVQCPPPRRRAGSIACSAVCGGERAVREPCRHGERAVIDPCLAWREC